MTLTLCALGMLAILAGLAHVKTDAKNAGALWGAGIVGMLILAILAQ